MRCDWMRCWVGGNVLCLFVAEFIETHLQAGRPGVVEMQNPAEASQTE